MIEYSGKTSIAVTRNIVWSAINNPEILKACIPGCTEFTGTPEKGYLAVVTQKIGPVKATFRGNVQLTDIFQEESCTIVGEGKGGAAGFAKGLAKVSLKDIEGGTEVTYTVDARIGGKIAQIGSRLVKGVAKKVADEFFKRLQAKLGGEVDLD